MSKYSPLRDYLARQRHREFELTFKEIEAIVGVNLPARAGRPQWWANQKAGYDAFPIVGSDKVKFRGVAQFGQYPSTDGVSMVRHLCYCLDGRTKWRR
jgi:hypothetical protein